MRRCAKNQVHDLDAKVFWAKDYFDERQPDQFYQVRFDTYSDSYDREMLGFVDTLDHRISTENVIRLNLEFVNFFRRIELLVDRMIVLAQIPRPVAGPSSTQE